MQPIPYFGERLEGEWIYEPKIDGWRMEVIVYDTKRIEFWGRRLEKRPNWTEKLEYLKSALNKLPPGTILDTELYTENGRRYIPSLFSKNRKIEPVIYVFDIIYKDNEFLGNLPLIKRKEILSTLSFRNPFNLIEYQKLKEIKRDFEDAVKMGAEGIIIKKIDSPYWVGKDGPIATHYWRKIK
jgi:ATP-dependent DNA ligase